MKKILFNIILIGWIMMAVLTCSACGSIQNGKEGLAKPVQKAGVSSAPEITDMILPADDFRPRTTEITRIMVHFSSNALNNPRNPYDINDIYSIFKGNGVSVHYVIGRDGHIYRMVPEDMVAFHAGKGDLPGFPQYKDHMNDYSIGIELLAIGTRKEMLHMIPALRYDLINPSLIGYTNEQYKALNELLDYILERNPSIKKNREFIIGHNEYAPGRKTDPGSLFDWTRIGL
jgi:N-acetyl-anhydromuramyl-L-alanine amidase AmpD